MITSSTVRRALTWKARRERLRRLAAAEPGEVVEVRYLPRSLSPRRPRPVGGRDWVVRDSDRRIGACPCGAHDDPMEEKPPGWLKRLSPKVRAVHDAWTAREVALWSALVWAPEAAAEAARLRPDDRPTRMRTWAQFRPVLEALGVLPSPDHDSLPPADRWLEVCPSHGPPVVVARTSHPALVPAPEVSVSP